MPADPEKEHELAAGVVKRLVAETGIAEAQASELYKLLGSNWSSLVREARIIKKKG